MNKIPPRIWAYIIFSFACAICFCSCATDRLCAKCPSKIERHDSIIIKTEYKDTTIYISQPGVEIQIPNPCADLCDSLGRLKASFKFVSERKNGLIGTLKVVNGNLVLTCAADSLKAVIKGLNQTIKESKLTSIVKTITTKTNVLTKLQGFWITSAKILWLILLAVAGRMAWKYYRRFHLP